MKIKQTPRCAQQTPRSLAGYQAGDPVFNANTAMNNAQNSPTNAEEWLNLWEDYYARNPQKKHEEQRRLNGDWSEEEEAEYKRLAKTGVFPHCQDFIAWKNRAFTAEEENRIQRLGPNSWKAANDAYEAVNSINDPDAALEMLANASAILANTMMGKTPWDRK